MSWLDKLKQHQARVAAAVGAQQPSVLCDYVDRPPGWTVGSEIYFLKPPPGYEWSPSVIAAIRTFDPNFIPLWVVRTFYPPYQDASCTEERKYGHHVIARFETDPKIGTHIFPGIPWARGYPNYMEQILEGAPSDPQNTDLPGVFKPFGWETYYELLSSFICASEKVWHERFIVGPKERALVAKEKRKEERAYAEKDVKQYQQRQLDKLSDVEWSEFFRKGIDRPSRAMSKPFLPNRDWLPVPLPPLKES